MRTPASRVGEIAAQREDGGRDLKNGRRRKTRLRTSLADNLCRLVSRSKASSNRRINNAFLRRDLRKDRRAQEILCAARPDPKLNLCGRRERTINRLEDDLWPDNDRWAQLGVAAPEVGPHKASH